VAISRSSAGHHSKDISVLFQPEVPLSLHQNEKMGV
jgi:hypothetical protein